MFESSARRCTIETYYGKRHTICSFVFFISLFHIARSGHFVIKPSWKCKLDNETTEIKPSSRCGEQQRLRWELFSFPGCCCCCISPCRCWCCRWCFCFLTEFRVINHSFAASVPPPLLKQKQKENRQRARLWHELIELWKLLIYVVCPVESEQEIALLSTHYKSEDQSGFADLFIRLFFQDTLALEMFYPCRVGLVVASGLLGTREQRGCSSEADHILLWVTV